MSKDTPSKIIHGWMSSLSIFFFQALGLIVLIVSKHDYWFYNPIRPLTFKLTNVFPKSIYKIKSKLSETPAISELLLIVYLFICLSFYLFIFLSFYLFICLSVFRFIILSVYLFICLSVYLLTIFLSICLCLSMRLSIYIIICLYDLYIYLSVYLYIWTSI